MNPKREITFVLVHGAYHTARCWEQLTPLARDRAVSPRMARRQTVTLERPIAVAADTRSSGPERQVAEMKQ